jgi:hypothetical protein
MKKASVFYIDSAEDLRDLGPIIASHAKKKKICILARYCGDETLGRLNLRDMAVNAGLQSRVDHYVASKEQSLKDKIAELGYECIAYYGVNMDLYAKPVSEHGTKAKDMKYVYRYACVCSKCESIVSEIVKSVSKATVRKLREEYTNSDTIEVTETSSTINVIDTSNKCMVC